MRAFAFRHLQTHGIFLLHQTHTFSPLLSHPPPFRPMHCASDVDIKGVLSALAQSASRGWGVKLDAIMAVDIEYSAGVHPEVQTSPVSGK